MFDDGDPQVVAIAQNLHEKVTPSGVVVWYLVGESLHVVAHTSSPIDRPMDKVIQPKMSLGHLVCESDKTLVFDDTLSHPLLKDSTAVTVYGVMAYMGAPFYNAGRVVGGISAIHQHARRWSNADVNHLEMAAADLSRLI